MLEGEAQRKTQEKMLHLVDKEVCLQMKDSLLRNSKEEDHPLKENKDYLQIN